ncbi:hypothetical protein [uncultured Methylibium sp.]|uniref:hypothetical protein n=1 Tax=uncultured Methylibium sp. TaxID=381093 RepID=UPI0025F62588|nr:hypothetical protein [uncultured Methylibium sp.]
MLTAAGLPCEAQEARPSEQRIAIEPRAPAFACLNQPAQGLGPLSYPKDAADRKEAAVVRVKLTFKSADAAPSVDVLYNSGRAAFAGVVQDHVKTYRLPCLTASAAPVSATQEFQFVPGDGRKVIWSEPRPDADEGDEAMAACLKTKGRPEYPYRALRDGVQGTVLARMTFAGPDAAPQTEIVFDGGSAALANAVKAYVRGYRLPCLEAIRAPVTATQQFTFLVDAESIYVLKDASLKQFLGVIDGLDTQRVRFDLNTMGCPFDLRFTLYQPYQPNAVGEVGTSDPNRRELLEWLKTISLKLPPEAKRLVIGDSMTVAVPCGVLDLL